MNKRLFESFQIIRLLHVSFHCNSEQFQSNSRAMVFVTCCCHEDTSSQVKQLSIALTIVMMYFFL